jgi:lipoprotein-releasing system permease protein
MLDFFVRSVALRHIRFGIGQSALTVLVVTISVFLIIFLSSLIGGLQVDLIRNTTGAIPHITVNPLERLPRAAWEVASLESPTTLYVGEIVKIPQQQEKIEDWQVWMERLRTYDPNVTAVSPVASGGGFMGRGAKEMSVRIYGVQPELNNGIVDVESKMVAGRFYGLNSGEVVIGRDLAEELAVRIGDKVRLQSDRGNGGSFTVAGIYSTGFAAVDRTGAFVTLRDGQSLFELGAAVSYIGLGLSDIFRANGLALEMEKQIPYTIKSWMVENKALLSALEGQSGSTNLILVMTTLASGLAIAAILVMAVSSKQKEIGILKAMGARNRQILSLFALEGVLLAMIGAGFGTLLGVSATDWLSNVQRGDGMGGTTGRVFPIMLETRYIVNAWVIALAIGLVAALYPAWRASRVNAIDVIRGS